MPKAADSRMRLQTGIDIERVERFRKELRSSSRFFSRTFTPREVKYCMSKADPSIHFAGTFAAKEASTKAASVLTSRRIPITDFEVTRGSNGAPTVRYTGRNSEIKRIEIKVSLSHTSKDAVAVALALLPTWSK